MISLRHKAGCESKIKACESIKKFKIISHPDFDPFNLTNDIALIKLAQPLNLKYHKIVPICLPFGIEKVPSSMNGINYNKMSYFVSLPECYTSLKNFNRVNNSSRLKLKPLYEESQFCAQTKGNNINLDAYLKIVTQ